MTRSLRERSPWFLWPFAALFDLLGAVLCELLTYETSRPQEGRASD